MNDTYMFVAAHFRTSVNRIPQEIVLMDYTHTCLHVHIHYVSFIQVQCMYDVCRILKSCVIYMYNVCRIKMPWAINARTEASVPQQQSCTQPSRNGGRRIWLHVRICVGTRTAYVATLHNVPAYMYMYICTLCTCIHSHGINTLCYCIHFTINYYMYSRLNGNM